MDYRYIIGEVAINLLKFFGMFGCYYFSKHYFSEYQEKKLPLWGILGKVVLIPIAALFILALCQFRLWSADFFIWLSIISICGWAGMASGIEISSKERKKREKDFSEIEKQFPSR